MSLFSAIAVSASGMDAQRKRAELITENLANAETTRTPEGGPYKRKDAVFASAPAGESFGDVLGSLAAGDAPAGVMVSSVLTDDREPDRRYMPGHPDADADGYVSFPRINPAEEMVDLMSTSRSYEANVAAISSVKDMINRSLDIFR